LHLAGRRLRLKRRAASAATEPSDQRADWDLSLHLRTLLERHATANLENVWNGRPISKPVLADDFSRDHRRGTDRAAAAESSRPGHAGSHSSGRRDRSHTPAHPPAASVAATLDETFVAWEAERVALSVDSVRVVRRESG
jgi:hypothetical protein